MQKIGYLPTNRKNILFVAFCFESFRLISQDELETQVAEMTLEEPKPPVQEEEEEEEAIDMDVSLCC